MQIGQIATPVILAIFTLWGTVFGGLNQSRSSKEIEETKAWAAYHMKVEETRQKILDAAIAVLKAPPDKDRPEADKRAREWAIKVVSEYKTTEPPVPVPEWWPASKPSAAGTTSTLPNR